ncbi:MAG: MotA/TolQ/ExbB proton channel family protein [Spirochaetales bacterium]|nr:MotA/TolQ/ExbB proton channel family protein [Spirochaetales bacterium]
MIEMIRDSFTFLIPLLLISLYLLALILELLFSLKKRVIKENHFNQILHLVERGRVKEAAEATRSRSQENILNGSLRIFQKNSPPDREDYLFDLALREVEKINRRVSLLPALANISTLLGLLGTVAGMILVFYNMKTTGSSDPYILAGGISQALITTAAGLIIAVPAYLFHLLLKNQVHVLEEQLELTIDCIMNLYREKREDARKKARMEEN